MIGIQCKSCGLVVKGEQTRAGRCPACGGATAGGRPAGVLNYGTPSATAVRQKMFRPWLLTCLAAWVLAQAGAFVALMNDSLNLLYASVALAWIGGLGIGACVILQKGQNLLWLIPAAMVWVAPIPLARAGIYLPSSMGMMVWVAGMLLLHKLPDKFKTPAVGAAVA